MELPLRSTITLDLNSGIVSNSNKIELYTISAISLLSKSMEILPFIWFKGVDTSVEIQNPPEIFKNG